MKIHLISDVHGEMGTVKTKLPEGAELVVMAGDIHSGVEGVGWAQENFGQEIPIIYVAGNHEFYDEDISVTDEMAEAAKGTNVHFLDNESVVIDDVRFVGSTLWTSFNNWNDPANIEFLKRNMNDYEYIKAMWFFEQNPERLKLAETVDQSFSLKRFEGNRFRLIPIIQYILHQEAMAYLEEVFSKPFEGKTVVVSHHAPSCKSVGYHKEAYEDAYATALDYFVYKHQEVISAWFHGHLHQPVSYKIGDVPIISNPRDYPCYGGHADVEKLIFEI